MQPSKSSKKGKEKASTPSATVVKKQNTESGIGLDTPSSDAASPKWLLQKRLLEAAEEAEEEAAEAALLAEHDARKKQKSVATHNVVSGLTPEGASSARANIRVWVHHDNEPGHSSTTPFNVDTPEVTTPARAN